MYAIIRSGSRQYRVKVGDLIDVDLTQNAPGEAIEFHDVLFIGDEKGAAKIGTPVVKGSRVLAQCVAEVKGRKIHSVKYKQRKNQYRKFGHRARYTRVKIVDIVG
jgi:large subunit ribosomal protein L21